MKKLFILLWFVFASVVAFSQGIQTGGIFLRVADSAAYVNSTYVTTSHSNNWRGDYAGTTTFPSTGGTHTAGVPGSGDMWRLTATLVVGGNVYGPGTVLLAAIDTPGQTLTNWIKLAAQL